VNESRGFHAPRGDYLGSRREAMDFFELKDISERSIEIINPFSLEKAIRVGEIAGLADGMRVIDFGCGYGEWLRIWAEEFGITGIGIDIRESACQRAVDKMQRLGLQDRIEIVCLNAADYAFEDGAYDIAICIGATFIWDGFRPSIKAMRRAVRPMGKVIVGEAFWKSSDVPEEIRSREYFSMEHELLQWSQEEGYEILSVLHASHDDWDTYESANWRGLADWLEGNPGHPNRQDVIDHLHGSQEEYFQYGREFIGWAVYTLIPSDTLG
jgi:cyclopropane fatty-acyl-phospholipid synthase-like methyltransferase